MSHCSVQVAFSSKCTTLKRGQLRNQTNHSTSNMWILVVTIAEYDFARLGELAGFLRFLSGMYDQAARAASSL